MTLHVFPGPVSDLSEVTRFMGANLRRARRSRGLTQVELADLLNATQPVISSWESGIAVPTPMQQARMTDLFMNSRGEMNRLLDRLLTDDPCVTLFSKVGSELRFVHMGEAICQYVGVGKRDWIGKDLRSFFSLDWRARAFGDRNLGDIMHSAYDYDLCPLPGKIDSKPARLIVDAFNLDLEGCNRVHVQRSQFSKATGKPPNVDRIVHLSDLGIR